jgi:hypothetical protein
MTRPHRQPVDYLALGTVAVLAGFLLSATETVLALVGVVLIAVGGGAVLVGIVALGVRVGLDGARSETAETRAELPSADR